MWDEVIEANRRRVTVLPVKSLLQLFGGFFLPFLRNRKQLGYFRSVMELANTVNEFSSAKVVRYLTCLPVCMPGPPSLAFVSNLSRLASSREESG